MQSSSKHSMPGCSNVYQLQILHKDTNHNFNIWKPIQHQHLFDTSAGSTRFLLLFQQKYIPKGHPPHSYLRKVHTQTLGRPVFFLTKYNKAHYRVTTCSKLFGLFPQEYQLFQSGLYDTTKTTNWLALSSQYILYQAENTVSFSK